MGITVFGSLTVDGSGRLGPRDRVVLQALACRPGQPVSADELFDALWGDHPPASAAKNLQSCVVRIRKALGPDAVVTTRQGYELALPADQIDARTFEAEVLRARDLLAVGEADRVAFLLDRALQLCRGPAFEELGDWEPARNEAARLEELRLEAEELRVDAQLRRGKPREILATAQAMVTAAPLRERRWCLLATTQYASGNQGEALRTLRQLRHVLAEQLGVDPGAEAEDLERAILQQDASLPAATPSLSSAECPWLGLRSYDVDDADHFFGREADVSTCLDLLARTSLVAIVGPSGSGKSSIMRAGVLATLRRRGHPLVVITPGHHPVESLAALSDDATSDTVLAVDQAEEVFTLCDDAAERREFWDRVTRASDLRPVVLSLRADRLGDVTEHPRLRLRVERGLHLVGSLDAAGLRQIAHGPARQAGLHIEPGLVDLLVREVGDDPGALPLLSHALVETWQRREGATLTVDGYLGSGGIHGAVARSAERLYAKVEPERRHLLRNVVLRLISPGPAGEPVRTRVPRRQLATDRDHADLIESLVAARLVTSDEGVLEITHEALARAWPRLRGWLDDDLEGQRILHHLRVSADAWDGLGRPTSELYRGMRLTRALEWSAQTRSTLTTVEQDFLAAAQTTAEDEEQAEVRTARAQAMLIRRLRMVLTGAVVLLVLALASGGLAAVQSQRAGSNAEAARESERQALARQAGSNALVTDDIGASTRMALASVALEESPDTRTSLLGTLARHPQVYESVLLAEGALPMYLEASPDRSYVALLDEEYIIRMYDASTGEELARRPVGPPVVKNGDKFGRLMAFSPDGRYLAVTGTPNRSRPVRVLTVPHLTPGPRLGRLPARGWQSSDVVFSERSGHLAAVIARFDYTKGDVPLEARALVWDLARPNEPQAFPLDRTNGNAVALDPGGTTLYTSHPLRQHDLRTGRTRPVFANDDDHYVWRMQVLRGGRQLLAVDDLVPTLFDIRSGRVVATYDTGKPTFSLRLAPDHRSFASISWGLRHVTLWALDRSQAPTTTFPLDRGSSNTVVFGPDGSHLLAVGEGGRSLRRWDLTGNRQFIRSLKTPSEFAGLFGVLAPGRRFSVVLTEDGGWGLTDHRTGTTSTIPRQHPYRHTYGAFHPTRPLFATATGRRIRIWDIATGRATGPARLIPGGSWITELDWTPDARYLAVSTLSGRVSLHDGTTLEQTGRPVALGEPVSFVVARPDGHTAVVLTGSAEPDGSPMVVPGTGWALVDFRDGRVVRQGEVGFPFLYWLALSPDGRTAAVAGGGHADAAGNAGATGSLQLINLTSGKPVGAPQTWEGGVRPQVAFSPDGSRLLTTSPGGIAVLWDAATLDPLARIRVPDSSNAAGAFEPDGQAVGILDWSTGSVVVWELDFDSAIDFACRVAGRGFTPDEWREQFGDEPHRETC